MQTTKEMFKENSRKKFEEPNPDDNFQVRKSMKKVAFASNSKIIESGSFRKSSNKSYISDGHNSGHTPTISQEELKLPKDSVNQMTARLSIPTVQKSATT